MATPNTKPLSTEEKPREWFKPDAQELARHSDPEKNRQLSDSLRAQGQLQEVAALEDGRMILGHGRWLASGPAGLKTLRVRIYPASLTDTQIKLIRAAENLHRNELTAHRKWLICADLIRDNPTWLMKDLAEQLHLDPSMVTRLMSPSKCTQAWQEALAAGKVGISDCYAASKLDETEQAELLRLKLSGASRDAIEQAGRKARATSAPTVRMSKVKIAMPQGASVVVSGPELSMSDLVELLNETLKQARRAAEQFDVKTWVRMMADKARAAK